MAYTEEGQKAQTDDLSQQRKKKKIFVVAKPFPYVESRIEVIEEMEVILFHDLLSLPLHLVSG
jgi:hypothetical protein